MMAMMMVMMLMILLVTMPMMMMMMMMMVMITVLLVVVSLYYLVIFLVCLLQNFSDDCALISNIIAKMSLQFSSISTYYHSTGEFKRNYLTDFHPGDVKEITPVMCCVYIN